MIIDNIMNFLQFDIATLFASESNNGVCGFNFSTVGHSRSEEKCIANVYQPRPKIFAEEVCCDIDSYTDEEQEEEEEEDENEECQVDEGDDDHEENDNENMFEEDMNPEEYCSNDDIETQDSDECCIQESAESCIQDSSECFMTDSTESCIEEEPATTSTARKSSCEKVSQKLLSDIAKKCSTATVSELKGIEERATKLWNSLNTPDCNGQIPKNSNWWTLKSWQKLPFYWAALSNEILNESPYENFKRFYVDNKRGSRRMTEKKNAVALNTWKCLDIKQKLPFIMEAFIAKVSAGKVSIRDEREIQKMISELYNKSC